MVEENLDELIKLVHIRVSVNCINFFLFQLKKKIEVIEGIHLIEIKNG